MEYGRIAGVDKDVSRVGQGLVMVGKGDIEADFALLDAVYEAGINLFDSAFNYGGGSCDRAFGQWVRDRNLRDKVVLMDKGCHHKGDQNCVSPDELTSQLNACIERLGFDCIDIFSFHRDDEAVPVEPLIDRLNEHVREGKIRVFGASNWTHERIRRANEYAEANGLDGFAVASPQYSLAECVEDPWGRGSVTITGAKAAQARNWYQANQMPIIPWSSLCGGLFSGQFSRDNLDTFTDGGDKRTVRCYCGEDNFRRLDRARELAAVKNATLAQIALAFLIRGPLNCFPLMAAWTTGEAVENAAAADIDLTPDEVAWLDLRD